MTTIQTKRKEELWLKVRNIFQEYIKEYGEIELENKEGYCIYIGKKANMTEPGRIIGM